MCITALIEEYFFINEYTNCSKYPLKSVEPVMAATLNYYSCFLMDVFFTLRIYMVVMALMFWKDYLHRSINVYLSVIYTVYVFW